MGEPWAYRLLYAFTTARGRSCNRYAAPTFLSPTCISSSCRQASTQASAAYLRATASKCWVASGSAWGQRECKASTCCERSHQEQSRACPQKAERGCAAVWGKASITSHVPPSNTLCAAHPPSGSARPSLCTNASSHWNASASCWFSHSMRSVCACPPPQPLIHRLHNGIAQGAIKLVLGSETAGAHIRSSRRIAKRCSPQHAELCAPEHLAVLFQRHGRGTASHGH